MDFGGLGVSDESIRIEEKSAARPKRDGVTVILDVPHQA